MFFVHTLVETTKKLKIIVYLYDACYVGINESDIYDDSFACRNLSLFFVTVHSFVVFGIFVFSTHKSG